MGDAPASLDLTLHVDPTDRKGTIEAEIEKEIGGVTVDVDAQVDQDGKTSVTVGVKIPI